MSSLEIAELTGNRHTNILRDIRNILQQAGIGALRFESSYLSSQNKSLPCYNLPKREAHLMVMVIRNRKSESYKIQAAVYDKKALEPRTAITPR